MDVLVHCSATAWSCASSFRRCMLASDAPLLCCFFFSTIVLRGGFICKPERVLRSGFVSTPERRRATYGCATPPKGLRHQSRLSSVSAFLNRGARGRLFDYRGQRSFLIYRREFCSTWLSRFWLRISLGPEDVASQNLETHGAKLAMIDKEASLPPVVGWRSANPKTRC